MTDQSAPLSWRDVHTLVQETRKEILAAMEKGFLETAGTLRDHANRITALEQLNLLETAAAAARALVATEAGVADRKRERAIERFLSGGRGTVLLVISLLLGAKQLGLLG